MVMFYLWSCVCVLIFYLKYHTKEEMNTGKTFMLVWKMSYKISQVVLFRKLGGVIVIVFSFFGDNLASNFLGS